MKVSKVSVSGVRKRKGGLVIIHDEAWWQGVVTYKKINSGVTYLLNWPLEENEIWSKKDLLKRIKVNTLAFFNASVSKLINEIFFVA